MRLAEVKTVLTSQFQKIPKWSKITKFEFSNSLPNGRWFLYCVFLHISAPKASEEVQKFKFVSGLRGGKKMPRENAFHRFILLGNPDATGKGEVAAIFTKTAKESDQLLRYFGSIRPGSYVAVPSIELIGLLGSSNNFLISTQEPLVPVDGPTTTPCDIFPSFVTGFDDYSFFSFLTKDLKIYNGKIRRDLCPGQLCDGQTKECGCLQKVPKRSFGLEMNVLCTELRGERVDIGPVLVQSCSLLKLVVHGKHDIDDSAVTIGNIFPMHFDDCARAIFTMTAENVGHYVTGWARAPKASDEGVCDARIMHIVAIRPGGDVPASAEELIFGHPKRASKYPGNAVATLPRCPGNCHACLTRCRAIYLYINVV